MEEDRYTRITLRIPKDLHSQLQKAADDTSKSTNAEIVARLQSSFEPNASMSMSSTHKDSAEPVAAPPTADEIADKVAEKINSGKMIQPISLDVLEKYLHPGETRVEDLYRRIVRALALVDVHPDFKRYEIEMQAPKRDNTPYGPTPSSNARKRLPKKS